MLLDELANRLRIRIRREFRRLPINSRRQRFGTFSGIGGEFLVECVDPSGMTVQCGVDRNVIRQFVEDTREGGETMRLHEVPDDHGGLEIGELQVQPRSAD